MEHIYLLGVGELFSTQYTTDLALLVQLLTKSTALQCRPMLQLISLFFLCSLQQLQHLPLGFPIDSEHSYSHQYAPWQNHSVGLCKQFSARWHLAILGINKQHGHSSSNSSFEQPTRHTTSHFNQSFDCCKNPVFATNCSAGLTLIHQIHV